MVSSTRQQIGPAMKRFSQRLTGHLRRFGLMPEFRLKITPETNVTAIDRNMMRRAIELARQAADMEEVPVGAVVYRGNQIIAEGCNLRESTHDPVTHAELLAVSKAGRALKEWRLNDCSIAVTLEPCPMCAGAMVNARIGRLLYGAVDKKAGACESIYRITSDKRLNHHPIVISGVLAEECAQLLKDFFKHRREVNKRKKQIQKRSA